MTYDTNYAPVCGIYCGSCELLDKQCRGCGYVDGKPFWAEQFGVRGCPLHNCCRNSRHLEHCGLCTGFPCKIFLEMRDPSMSDEEAQKSLETRQADLSRRKRVGTDEWLKEKGHKEP